MAYSTGTSGQYYKPMMILNDDSRVVNKLETSLTDDARVVIYDHHMFIVQATVAFSLKLFTAVIAPISHATAMNFHPSIIFVGKARSLPLEWNPVRG
jgi:hypothetical protein